MREVRLCVVEKARFVSCIGKLGHLMISIPHTYLRTTCTPRSAISKSALLFPGEASAPRREACMEGAIFLLNGGWVSAGQENVVSACKRGLPWSLY